MQLQESTWTDHRTAELQKFFDLGLSCSHIGKRIGVTRNAVIGKLHRMGLTRPRDPVEKKAKTPRTYNSNVRFRKQRPILQRVHDAVGDPDETLFVQFRGVTLLELNEFTCRWPINEPGAEEFCFCGNEPYGKLPYCVGHARLAYRGARPPRGEEQARVARKNLQSSRTTFRSSMDREDGAAA